MDHFRTEFPLQKTNFKIEHNDNIISIGSCFAQEISGYLNTYRFKVSQSPFGIVFNPFSIEDQIRKILNNYTYKDADLILHQGVYHSMDHHSRSSRVDKVQMIKEINDDLSSVREKLAVAHYLIVTFGSAYYYNYLPDQKVVANCHKIPSTQFEKKKANVTDLVKGWNQLILDLLNFNPNLKIIYSISPVRYLRDGFVENTRSKATLIQLVESLQHLFPDLSYFPAYEIFMDDLRDYRFVKEDLVHPNDMAIQYICQYFFDFYFSKKTLTINERIKEINSMQGHKLLHPESDASKSTMSILKGKIAEFKLDYPEITFY